MKIGIPRALFYFKNPYFWEVFFKGLGEEVVLSPKTNREIVAMGVKNSDPENCFSMKVFFGHILWLEGKCDFIFVPRLKTNREKLEYCPKFFGLPDLVKILVKTPILTKVFNERKEKIKKTLTKLGEKLNKNKKTIKKAIKLAFLKEKEIKKKQNQDFFKKIISKKKKIILISHHYNLYDDYVNLRMEEKLKKLKIEPLFIDQIPLKNQKIKNQNFDWPGFHWEFGEEIGKQINEILKYKISGAIEISSLQCGCDAVLKEFIEREFKKNKIPFLYLIIDEHTGEAGFQTRLEAFADTLRL